MHQNFVNADNAAFAKELQEWENSAATRQQNQTTAGEEWDHTINSRPPYPSPSTQQVPTEGIPASKVNVFDYQVASFDDVSTAEGQGQGQGQEMQERGGKPLLGQAQAQSQSQSQSVPPGGKGDQAEWS